MKKILLHTAAIFALVTGGVTAYAQMPAEPGGAGQYGHGQPPTVEQRLQRMTRELNLTADQQQKIKPILENESTQMQALHSDSSLSEEDRMAKMRQIRQTSSAQIKPILNADQQQKFTDMMNRPGRGRGGPQSGQAPPPPPQ